MAKSSIHPPGDKIQKAIKEFSYQLAEKPEEGRLKLLRQVATKFDLSPLECDFLERHFKDS